jgi:hypothetical protein
VADVVTLSFTTTGAPTVEAATVAAFADSGGVGST